VVDHLRPKYLAILPYIDLFIADRGQDQSVYSRRGPQGQPPFANGPFIKIVSQSKKYAYIRQIRIAIGYDRPADRQELQYQDEL
jgi:hypothetical protein